MPQPDVNYLALLVATVLAFALGALWYSNLMFARPWLAAQELTEAELKERQEGKSMPLMFGLTFLAWLVTGYVLAHMVDYTGAITWMDGMQTAFWLWLGFVVTATLIHGLFEFRDVRLYAVNLGYHLVGLLIMGAILAAWA